MEILPIGDALGEAMKILKSDADKKGIEMLIRKFDNILETHGVEILEVKIGDKFDPYIHNAISSGGEKVMEILQKGYKFSGRVIRPAMVRI
jgi:molecular chaperone GrpE